MTDQAHGAAPSLSWLPARPGKVIAVHLSYASRADQRGRRPEAPSYFLKPASSIARSGETVPRPPGTELLAFEGEIALIIGTPARHVGLREAWRHVGWVTAANDLGVYDLRANDKGSNLRSKGRDGFTPLGPTLLDAATVDPAALRIRSWVNGTLVQDDTTAGLLFPLAQFVADLSQHLTLEIGDVILTGTPAGSSVIVPGDVVEVEVDEAAGGSSSGRLVTTIGEAAEPAFDPALGSLPSVDDAQRIAAWGSPQAAGLAEVGPEPDTAGPAPSLPADLRAKLEAAPLASLSSQLRKRGLNHVSIDGVRALPGSGKLVGVAKTLRFVPFREDLFAAAGGGYNAQKRAFDAVRPGEVLVIEARGDDSAGTLGDILALRAKTAGAAGVVTDGAVRDHDAVAATGIPVYCNGSHPAVLGRRHVPWDSDITIGCGGATVQPGDIIVGDGDGVLVIPPALAAEVADAALAQEDSDGWIADRVGEGHRLEGLFPMNADWRRRFESAQADGGDESGGETPR